MQLTGRDRLLAGLFVLQLTAAAAFGLVLVDALGDEPATQVLTLELPGSSAPAVKEYEAAVRKSFGSRAQLNYIGVQGWIGAKAFVDALRRIGPRVDREALITAVEQTDGQGGLGFAAPLRFGPYAAGTRDINRCLKIAKVVQGKAVPVTDWRCDNQPF